MKNRKFWGLRRNSCFSCVFSSILSCSFIGFSLGFFFRFGGFGCVFFRFFRGFIGGFIGGFVRCFISYFFFGFGRFFLYRRGGCFIGSFFKADCFSPEA